MYHGRIMTWKQLLMVGSLYVFYTSVSAQADDVYDKSELSHCTGHIYRLISCLTDGKPHIFESRKCDNILSQTVMCLAAYRPENQLGPVPLETEDDFVWNVSKRGLGKCIHKCLNGQGRMNFIQCKNMCHR